MIFDERYFTFFKRGSTLYNKYIFKDKEPAFADQDYEKEEVVLLPSAKIKIVSSVENLVTLDFNDIEVIISSDRLIAAILKYNLKIKNNYIISDSPLYLYETKTVLKDIRTIKDGEFKINYNLFLDDVNSRLITVKELVSFKKVYSINKQNYIFLFKRYVQRIEFNRLRKGTNDIRYFFKNIETGEIVSFISSKLKGKIGYIRENNEKIPTPSVLDVYNDTKYVALKNRTLFNHIKTYEVKYKELNDIDLTSFKEETDEKFNINILAISNTFPYDDRFTIYHL